MSHTKFLSTAQVIPNLKRFNRRIRPRYGIRSPIIVYQMVQYFWTDAERAALIARWTVARAPHNKD
ncbi:MAG: hypothetical protein B6D41_09470 [Chloroflexi bacterium UTCFX4]|jgi:hypothetical protein|nr:MAG: hypothetical protein B6D41_09470 [Chloroflexi bacterium UTCFX4]